jgi:tetratricopeptide (TPR) repeat protein
VLGVPFDLQEKYKSKEKKEIGEINARMLKLANAGNFLKALEILDEAFKIDPNDELSLVNKGVILSQIGKYNEAIEIYDSILKNNPKLSSVYYNKASCFSLLGKIDEALDLLEKAIQIRPAFIETLKKDEEFSVLKNLPRFQNLIGN